MNKEKMTNFLATIGLIFIITFIIWLFANSVLSLFGGGFSGKKYHAYKCNYRAALFGPNANEIIKEFGGDPCMKKGNNRFKSYYPKKFKSLSDCQYWIDTEDMSYLKAPKHKYVLGCDKK